MAKHHDLIIVVVDEVPSVEFIKCYEWTYFAFLIEFQVIQHRESLVALEEICIINLRPLLAVTHFHLLA